MIALPRTRVVVRPSEWSAKWDLYAMDPTLTVWAYDRTKAHRFADHVAARQAINDLGRTCPTEEPEWIDPYVIARYRIVYPTIEAAAIAYVQGGA